MDSKTSRADKPTISTIAKRAGVSVSTVSYALSGKRPISEAVRERIRAVIDELGYRPDALARSFAGGRTRTIGFYVQSPENMRANAYFSAVLAGILSVFEAHGHQLVLYPNHESMLPDRETQLIERQAVDGIIILDQGKDDLYHNFLVGLDIPHAFLGRPRGDFASSFVSADHFGISYQAVQHLAERNRKRIVLINHPGAERGSDEKQEGYFAALARHGLSYSKVLVADGYQAANGEKIAEQILETGDQTDAIVSHNHLVTFGVVKGLKRAGVRIPQDISIVSAGEDETNQLQPEPFTALTMNPYRNGTEVAGLMIGLIQQTVEPPVEIIIPAVFKQGWTT